MKIKVSLDANRSRKVRIKRSPVVLAGICSVLGLGALLSGSASAINISDEVKINPEYESYIDDVRAGNGSDWSLIPNKYIFLGQQEGGYGGDTSLPASYSLVDEGFGTTIKNQGSEGICWAYATTSAIESYLKKNEGISVDLSAKNFDYLMSNATDIGDIVTDFAGESHQLGEGLNFGLASYGLSKGYGVVKDSIFFAKLKAEDPTTLSSYTSYNDFMNKGTIMYDLKAVLNPSFQFLPYTKAVATEKILSDVEYFVSEYSMYYGEADTTSLESVANVKNAVYNNGGVYTGTYYNTSTSACWDAATKTIIDRGGTICGSENGHAMTIVGWDDNHAYTDPVTGTTKKGAYLVQNSWGKSTLFSDYGYTTDSVYNQISWSDTATPEEKAQIRQQLDQYLSSYDSNEFVYLAYATKADFASIDKVEKAGANDSLISFTDEAQGFGGELGDEGNVFIYNYDLGDDSYTINGIGFANHGIPVQAYYANVSIDAGDGYVDAGRVSFGRATTGQRKVELEKPIVASDIVKVKVELFDAASNAILVGWEDDDLPVFTTSLFVTASADDEEEEVKVPDTGSNMENNEMATVSGIAATVVVLSLLGVGAYFIKHKDIFNKRVDFDQK